MKLLRKISGATAVVLTAAVALFVCGCQSAADLQLQGNLRTIRSALSDRAQAESFAEIDKASQRLNEYLATLLKQTEINVDHAAGIMLAELLESPYSPYADPQLAELIRQYLRKHYNADGQNRQKLLTQRQQAAELLTRAIEQEPDYPQKIELLHKALEKDFSPRPALALALVYMNKPQPDLPMAVNSLLLLENLPGAADINIPQLLAEADAMENSALTLLMRSIWNDRLRSGNDLKIARIPTDMLLALLRSGQKNAALQELGQWQKNDPDGFYASGISFRLREYSLSDSELEKLLSRIPEAPPLQLPALLTAAAVAGEGDSPRWQQASAAKLFEYIRQNPAADKLQPNLNPRRQLAIAIPDAVRLPWDQKSAADNQQLHYARQYNLAVYLQLNALLSGGKRRQAEEFLQQNALFQLPGAEKALEKNFVKRFARNILKSDGKVTVK